MELIAPYVQVGSAYLGVGNTKSAEKFLTQAHWLALKAKSPLPAVLEAKMHRSLGRLYLAKEKLAESLAHFAEDVYFSSCAYGPMDPQCCTGYFHMAILFETHDEQRCKVSFKTQSLHTHAHTHTHKHTHKHTHAHAHAHARIHPPSLPLTPTPNLLAGVSTDSCTHVAKVPVSRVPDHGTRGGRRRGC